MAEEKDTTIKVTDRRKFNPDGTPREQSGEPAAPQIEQAQAGDQSAPPAEASPGAEEAPGNVVSFPGETAKKKLMKWSNP